MTMRGKRLGIMVSAMPGSRNFAHGLRLASEAQERGVEVYLYLMDEGVHGLTDPRLARLKEGGMKLFACAFSLQKRNLPLECPATLAGLTLLNDILTSTDRFVSFN